MADERFHIDCDIAQFLSEEVIPYALDFYLGIIEDEDMYGGEDDYEDEEDDDDEDEPEKKPRGKGKGKKSAEEDDDDEEEEGTKKGKKKAQGGKPQNQECKQQ